MTAYVACLECGAEMRVSAVVIGQGVGAFPVHSCFERECGYYSLAHFPSYLGERFLDRREPVEA